MMLNDNGKIRVLCLHGHGQNSKVFEASTAALRSELGEAFEWHFVEGTIPVAMDKELEGYFPSNDQYFAFFDPNDPQSVSRAMDNLSIYVHENGPFPIIGCSSIATSLGASLILRHAQENPEQPALFDGAIFFNGYSPLSLAIAGNSELSFLDPQNHSAFINIPTANIWGTNDERHAVAAEALNRLCTAEMNEKFVHNNGSVIPGAAVEEDMIKAAQAIRRTVSRAIAAH